MHVCKIYLFVCASRHISTHVEVPRWVHKHNLEGIMELRQGWLHRMQKRKTQSFDDLSIRLMKLYNLHDVSMFQHSQKSNQDFWRG